MFDLLHFQEPRWLLAIIPLAIVLWLFSNQRTSSQSWAKIIDPNLLPLLLQGNEKQSSGRFAKWLLASAWLITIIALADPVWQKIPRPIFQTNSARVIVLDLSNSMLVDDIKPSRMARARFKVEDILSTKEEGQIGLVVFAGDAFTASPLTRDAETIRALLQVLTPSIMPSQGSRADLGLKKAHELLTQAGVINGQVLLITDGASDIDKAKKMAKLLNAASHTVSVLAVGTDEGGILQFSRKQQVNIKLETDRLHKIAKKGGGVLHKLTNNDSDLKAVLKPAINNETQQKKSDDLKADDWKSTGPFIILLLLPLAALAFRKGWLFNILIATTLATTLMQPTPVMADSTATKEGKPVVDTSWLNKLFKNTEQRADKALKNKQYDTASKLSNNPLRKGSAEYKKGSYEQALESFKSSKGAADAKYNEANALAKLKKYEEAIKAYDDALKQQPDMADAKTNKKALEEFLKKKKEQENKSQSDKNKENKKDQEKKDADKKDGSKDKKQKGKPSKDKNKGKDGESGKQGEKGEDGEKPNQFSDANKALDEKKEAEEEQNSSKKKEEGKKGKEDKKKADEKGEKNNTKKRENKEAKQEGGKGRTLDENMSQAEELNKEEKMAAEQWLRRIPDDPGGLLRRKFQRQYRQRRPRNNEQPW